MIKITETDSEYLLYIPEEKKDRLQGITGCRWDENLNCWAFQKSYQAYEFLISEFGDSDNEVLIIEPEPIAYYSKADNREPSPLTGPIPADVIPLSELRGVGRMQTGNIEPSPLTGPVPVEGRSGYELREMRLKEFEREAKRNAKLFSKNNEFNEIVDSLPFDMAFPIQMEIALTKSLKRILNIKKSVPLDDIINNPNTKKELNQETRDLANIIRRQRNIFAHNSVTLNDSVNRILLVLSSASCIYKHFVDYKS